MNVDTTTELLDRNPTNDLQSIEIAVGDNHAINSTSIANVALAEEADNEEERRLLHILSLACHKLQPKHDLSHHSDGTSCSTDQPSKDLLWSTIDNALKSLCVIWLNTTSTSSTSLMSLLRKSTRCGNLMVSDHEIEVVLSCILTIWHHSLDSLSDDVTNSTILSVILSSIQLLSQSTQSIHWKHELVNHQMEKLVVLLPKTASILLSKSSSSDKCASINCDNEEKKADDAPIHEINKVDNSKPDTNVGIVRAVFRMVKDISYDESKKSISTNSGYMITLYNAMHPVVCDIKVYSKTIFMIDVSSILWRWSVSLARCMVDNACVWNTIQFMWMNSNVDIDGHEIVIRALASAVGMLIASVPCEEATTTVISSSSTSSSSSPSSLPSISSEYDKSIRMIQEQEWLMPMLLKGIRTTDSDSQRRCIRTLRYLTASTWGKSFVFQYAQHKGLTMDVLTIVRNDGRHDEDTCALACQVLENILSDGHTELQLGPYIETSLLETIKGSSYGHDVDNNGREIKSRNKLVLSACQALIASLQYSPWNRSTGCFSEALFEEMLYILHNNVDQPSYHICFVNLFLQLVAEEGLIDDVNNDSRMKTTRIKGICVALASYSSFLEMLAILLSPNATKPDFDVPRSNTVRVLTVLLQHDDESSSIKNCMATDEHLLTALLNVCLMNNGSNPLKDEAKSIIMILIPEL